VIERLRRNALIACVVMACVASVIARSASWGIAVAGGGLLVGISFFVISSSVNGVAADRRPALLLLKVTGRYALLGFLAYVMIARLRLPPLGLILGASSFAVAALVELINNRRN
jgi:ATP synthase I subunit